MDNFVRLYKRVKSNFTLGFLLFAVLLLVKNISHAFLVLPLIVIGDVHASSLLGYNIITVALIPDTLELLALSIFLYLTREY